MRIAGNESELSRYTLKYEKVKVRRLLKKKGAKQMPGTVTGGKKAGGTNKRKYGEDFYKRIGAKGGKKGTTGGFAANRDLARIAGAKGGRLSRRSRVKVEQNLDDYDFVEEK